MAQKILLVSILLDIAGIRYVLKHNKPWFNKTCSKSVDQSQFDKIKQILTVLWNCK